MGGLVGWVGLGWVGVGWWGGGGWVGWVGVVGVGGVGWGWDVSLVVSGDRWFGTIPCR